jgi:hypothetical protein
MATWGNIRNGRGCPSCAKVNRANARKRTDITLESLQKYASKKQGLLLSKKYINTSTKLEWKCKNGHKWKDTYSMVRENRWCTKCLRSANEIPQKSWTIKLERL